MIQQSVGINYTSHAEQASPNIARYAILLLAIKGTLNSLVQTNSQSSGLLLSFLPQNLAISDERISPRGLVTHSIQAASENKCGMR